MVEHGLVRRFLECHRHYFSVYRVLFIAIDFYVWLLWDRRGNKLTIESRRGSFTHDHGSHLSRRFSGTANVVTLFIHPQRTRAHLSGFFRCFRTLGPFFTFEITIRPKHELITHGPYAWVRHPSYTGVYLTLGGATLVLSSPGTWTADHGVWTPLGFVVMCLWLSKCLYAFRGMCIRLRAEDRVLKDAFGAEWDQYAMRVPFNFIPGVI